MGEMTPSKNQRPRVIKSCATVLVVSLVTFLGFAVVVRLYTNEVDKTQRILHCANSMKLMGLGLHQYSDADERELFPPLSPEIGRLMPAIDAVYPNFLPDTFLYVCPLDSARFELEDAFSKYGWTPEVVDMHFDNSYFYLGYLVVDDNDMELFARAYREAMKHDWPMDDDYVFPDSRSSGVNGNLYRLRHGIERALMEDDPPPSAHYRAMFPVLIERVDNHTHEMVGANVLYLDGHVEFIRYPSKWPMTERTVRILNELDALGESRR
jgi:prepilin-type processing-associated H-X9-DG protein